MIKTFNKSFYKNGYLLIIAAWLYTISFIFSNYWFYTSSPDRVKTLLESYLKKSEKKFEDFTSDSAFFEQIINGSEPQKALELANEAIGLYTYIRNNDGSFSLVYWNSNKVLPDNKDIGRPDGKYFTVYSNGQFEFIKKTIYVRNKQLITAGVIPVHWNYFFENKYLRPEFVSGENIEKRYSIVASDADVYIRNGDGKVLYGLKEKKKVGDDNPGIWSLSLRVLSIIFAFIFLHVYASEVVLRRGFARGFLFLTGSVFFLRMLSYTYAFPFNYKNLALFDPAIYASNSVHPSLGDLFINIILIFWLISFAKFAALDKLRNLKEITGKKGWWVSIVLSVFLIVLAFICAGVIRSLISDSKISFDVTNFFSISVYSVLSFIILCLIVLSFFHFSHIALIFIYKSVDVPVYGKYLLIAVAGLLYLSLNLHDPASVSNVIVLLWLILYLFILEYQKEDIYVSFIQSSFFLIWLIFFAASISALIIYQNSKVELEQRKKIAEKLAGQVDPSAINSMSIGITEIDSNFLASNFKRLTYETTNKAIKDSLINEIFSGYLNKYDTRLYTFDYNYHPLYNEDSASFASLTNIIWNRSTRTEYPDMYYYENASNGYSLFYQKEIKDSAEDIQGYFFVVAEPKKYKSQAVYPELFKQVKDLETDLDVNYAYAVYNAGKLVTNSGDYNFRARVDKDSNLKQEFKEVKDQDNSELWYNAGNNKIVIIVKSGSLFIEFITLFAYLFGSFLFVVVMFQVANLLIRFKFRFNQLRHGIKLNIRQQIQASIIFISIFSFLVIGIATISFYIARFRQTNRDRLVKAINVLASEIEAQVDNYDLAEDIRLEKAIKDIAEIHSVDANFYDLNGNLKVSTQPYMYKKQILSKVMEPNAFYHLHYNGDIQFIQEERVSHFSFLSIYVPVKNEEGRAYAYLNIPYLNTQKEARLT